MTVRVEKAKYARASPTGIFTAIIEAKDGRLFEVDAYSEPVNMI